MLSLKEIKELIDLVCERGLGGLEIERAGFRLRIEGRRAVSDGLAQPLSSTAAQAEAPPAATPVETSAPEEDVHLVKSPIVGTFYRSPSQEANPFTEIGQHVSKGKTLCIIESMKLMNEIESDVEGEVVAVYPRDGQPVEYGERLFAIKLAA